MNDKITITFDETLSDTRLEQVRRQIRKLLRGETVKPPKPAPGSTVGIVPRQVRTRPG